jgi:glycosyltransferase involved in cell wall biosynthesis
VDVVHLAYPTPVNTRRFSCPVVLTLHDLYPYDIPMNFGFPQLIFNRLILRQCLRQVHSIACVSDATRARLEQHAPTKVWERSIRIYNCVEPGPPPSPEPPLAGWRDEPFLLCVAQHRRNKNLLLLIRAFHELLKRGVVEANTRLVIVGIAGPETQDVRDLVRQSGLSGAVALMEGVSEAGLQWLYKHCRCLVAPSSTEGFGLSIAEGLLAGCRVVCSDILAFREVGGSRCHFFTLDGDHPEPLIHAVASALHSERPEQLELPHFSSGMLAGQYLDFYRSAIESQKAASRWLRGEMAVPVRGAQ